MNNFKKGNFNKDNRPGGFSRGGMSRPSFGAGPRRPAGRDSYGPSESFKTSCSKCNAACEVPFKPNGKKPVYCKNCFVRDDTRSSGGSYEKRSYGPERPSAPAPTPVEDPRIGAMQKELAIVHAKLDTLIEHMGAAAYSSIIAASREHAEKPKAAAKKTVAAKKKAAKKK